MATKKYYLRELRKIDLSQGKSLVRELEMSVDCAVNDSMYSLQFWRDCELYGIDEAILYVKNGNHGNWQAIEEKWQEIKKREKLI